MAADSDGSLTAVVICEGDLHDPEFPRKFRSLLGKLKTILDVPAKRPKKCIKVNKVSGQAAATKTTNSMQRLITFSKACSVCVRVCLSVVFRAP